MTIQPTRQQRRQLEADNKKWPEVLKVIPFEEWPLSMRNHPKPPMEVWRSRYFLVQIFAEESSILRLSVCRTSHNGESWEENICWDDLQKLKSECGLGSKDAVEVYPSQIDVVNVANMRHLWVLPMPLPFAWRKS